MKRFKIIKDKEVKFQIEGDSIEKIFEGAEMPEVWKSAVKSGDFEEEDIVEELKLQEEEYNFRLDLNTVVKSLLSDDKEALESFKKKHESFLKRS